MLKDTRPEDVEEMISNVERVLKKSYKDAEKAGYGKTYIFPLDIFLHHR